MVSSPWVVRELIDVILHASVVLGSGGPSCPRVQGCWSQVISEEAAVWSGQASLPKSWLITQHSKKN